MKIEINIDSVIRRCKTVVEINGYLVLFGDALDGGVMVVKRYQGYHDYDHCSFCGASTTGRIVHAQRVEGKMKITAIDACCKTCNAVIGQLDPSLPREDMVHGVLLVLAAYRVVSPQSLHTTYQARLKERVRVHSGLIAEAGSRVARIGKPVVHVETTDFMAEMNSLLGITPESA